MAPCCSLTLNCSVHLAVDALFQQVICVYAVQLLLVDILWSLLQSGTHKLHVQLDICHMMQLQQQLKQRALRKSTAGTPAYVNRHQLRPRRLAAAVNIRRSHVGCRCSAEAAAVQETAEAVTPSSSTAASTTPSTVSSVPNSDIIELDFCSRPLLDERGKKVWELLVCSPDRSFEYSQYFPNNKINSAEVSVGGRRGTNRLRTV